MPNVWIEKSKVKGRIDREEGETRLGKALWSPQKDERGADIYSNMRKIKTGDIIFHLIDDGDFVGVSKAQGEVDTSFIHQGNTPWSNKPAYRVNLIDFVKLEIPLLREDFLNETNRQILDNIRESNSVFYQENLNLRQGGYITEAPTEFLRLINSIYLIKSGKNLPYILNNIEINSDDTIAQAAKKVFKNNLESLTLNEIYSLIIKNSFYSFGAEDPVSALRIALDRRCQNVSRQDGLKEKWFIRYENQKYALIREKNNFPINVILYGPPGTGKTYDTKFKAIEIIEGGLNGSK